ncbi:hypothetical protein A3B87_03660 [Candidatus Kuenenbacteria bacterium RIFCSPHIGHO2_02_FULL_39_13]|uniref:Uncharacterized protein n=1 Tax=Candidatus Kuenenbacteria bacterium RIFCSPHIGHO2_02_FULL_39_13 TaxID=1798561 RepID=A0A1F6FMM0_9BACT|nr:MAG: hypothetical protein A3B87_03660 [Candidatus Kuenenbacteria bacterium RIFCSPHIGHO2_02_FULL_39_13]
MSTKSKKIKNNEFDKDMKELVKARLNVLPKNVSVSIGQEGTFNREELIEHVDKEDNIGQKITQVEMEFLQAIKKGELYENPIDYQTGL